MFNIFYIKMIKLKFIKRNTTAQYLIKKLKFYTILTFITILIIIVILQLFYIIKRIHGVRLTNQKVFRIAHQVLRLNFSSFLFFV